MIRKKIAKEEIYTCFRNPKKMVDKNISSDNLC